MLALLLASVLVLLALRGMDLRQAWLEITGVRPGWIALAVLLNLAILVGWAAAWRVFLPARRRASYGRVFEVVAMTATAINTTPFLAGHASGVVLLARRARAGTGAALSVMAQHELLEGLAKATVVLTAALLAPLPTWMRQGLLALLGGVAVLGAALLLATHGRRLKMIVSRGAPWAAVLRRRARPLVRWTRHLETLRSPRRFALGLALLIGMKLAEAAAIVAVQRAFGVTLPLSAAPLLLAATMLATMVPLVPANMGAYEAAAFLVYRELGLPPEQALGLALVQHLCLLLPLVGTGYLALVLASVRAGRTRRRAQAGLRPRMAPGEPGPDPA